MDKFLTHHDLPAPVAAVEAPCDFLRSLLAQADVRINGSRPWDIQVRRGRLWGRVLRQWSLGFGEAYVDGDWDCEQLDELFARLMRLRAEERAIGLARARLAWEALRHSLANLQSPARAYQVAERHYDVGPDVFAAMLDARMIYSCAYWPRAHSLDEAQTHKLDLICRKLELGSGHRLLDIGCGWGGLAQYAAQTHGAQVTGLTVSREQLEAARQRCAGLDVTLLLQDYRDVQGRFDRVASVGMFEHVGPKNYAQYFDTVYRVLDPQGLFLLHTIGLDETSRATDPWIDKYVFPNGKLPSARELTAALEGRFLVEDWHNFGADYDRTLMCWWQRFDAAWPQLQAHYPARFYRQWRYYLHACAGFFRSRQGQLWQLVLAPRSRKSAYRSVR